MPVIGYPKDNVEPFLGDTVPAVLGGFVEGIVSVFAHTSSEARERRRLEKLRVLDPTHFGGVEDIINSK